MAQIPIVGPSYTLRVRKADVQRSVNLFPSIVESGSGKAPAILHSIPGLTLFANLGAEIRGLRTAKNGRLFGIGGATLNEISATGAATELGSLASVTGAADINENLNQLIITDGPSGYVFKFSGSVFSKIVSPSFLGSTRSAVLDGYAIFARPGGQQFILSAVDDATTFDPLDFASAEGSPDAIIAPIVDHGQLMLFGSASIEIWDNTGGNDFPLTRNNGARIETGCEAAFSVRNLDNTVYWLGADERGGGIVWKLSGYTPVRVSTQAIEEMIQSIPDRSAAVAYTYQQDGHSFYALNVPGLATTLVFDVASGNWHERAELVNGEYTAHRGRFHAYAFGKHLIGGADGKIYSYDPTVNNNAGDVLVRDRISPHMATPGYALQKFSSLQVDCAVGAGLPDGSAPSMMMRYSNDGGNAFGGWKNVSMGAIGQRSARAIFRRLGEGYDRVWQIRVTDDVPFSIVGASVT